MDLGCGVLGEEREIRNRSAPFVGIGSDLHSYLLQEAWAKKLTIKLVSAKIYIKLLCHGYFRSTSQTILSENKLTVKIYKASEETTTIGKIGK